MSRLPVYSADSAPADSRPMVEKVQTNNGFVPNLIGVLAGAPQALETYLGVGVINAAFPVGCRSGNSSALPETQKNHRPALCQRQGPVRQAPTSEPLVSSIR